MTRALSTRPEHIDLAGAVLVALLGVGAYFGGIAPWLVHRAAAGQTRLAATEAASRQAAAQTEILSIESRLADLSAAVARREALTPRVTEWNAVVARMVTLANAAGLNVQSVTPHDPVAAPAWIRANVEMSAKGDVRRLIAFLAALAEQNAFHALERLEILGESGGAEGQCRVELTLQFYLLASEPPQPGAKT
jgi:Tfp pilus assembly protein PilO